MCPGLEGPPTGAQTLWAAYQTPNLHPTPPTFLNASLILLQAGVLQNPRPGQPGPGRYLHRLLSRAPRPPGHPDTSSPVSGQLAAASPSRALLSPLPLRPSNGSNLLTTPRADPRHAARLQTSAAIETLPGTKPPTRVCPPNHTRSAKAVLAPNPPTAAPAPLPTVADPGCGRVLTRANHFRVIGLRPVRQAARRPPRRGD